MKYLLTLSSFCIYGMFSIAQPAGTARKKQDKDSLYRSMQLQIDGQRPRMTIADIRNARYVHLQIPHLTWDPETDFRIEKFTVTLLSPDSAEYFRYRNHRREISLNVRKSMYALKAGDIIRMENITVKRREAKDMYWKMYL